MDPLSVISGITGTAAVALHTAVVVQDFISSIKDAPHDVANISKDIAAISDILKTLDRLIATGVVRAAVSAPLKEPIENCNRILSRLKDEIQPYTKLSSDGKIRKWRYMGWSFKKTDISVYRERLQQAKITLNLSISIINTYALETASAETRVRIEAASAQTKQDMQAASTAVVKDVARQMRAYDENKVDLASVRGGAAGSANGTDAGLPLRRYLEQLPSLDHTWVQIEEQDDILTMDGLTIDEDLMPVAEPDLKIFQISQGFPLSELFRAVLARDYSDVQKVIDRGADVNEKYRNGGTALHLCADLDLADIATLLITNGADLEITDEANRMPFEYAMRAESQHVAEMMITKEIANPLPALKSVLKDLSSDLMTVTQAVSIRKILRLLGPLNRKTPMLCPLIVSWLPAEASKEPRSHHQEYALGGSIVAELLDAGFNPNDPDLKGFTPLHFASWSHQVEVARVLLERGAKPDLLTSRDARVDPDGAGLGITSLHIAAGAGDPEMLQVLLDHGADVNAIDSTGGIALQAIGIFSPAVAKVLLDAGADIHNAKHDGMQIIHWATGCRNVPLLEYLIERGADVNAGILTHQRCLHLAADYDFPYVAESLLQHGAEVNAQDLYARSALHLAAYSNSTAVASILLDHGAVSFRDTSNETPFMISKRLGHMAVADLIERYGEKDEWKRPAPPPPPAPAKSKSAERVSVLKKRTTF